MNNLSDLHSGKIINKIKSSYFDNNFIYYILLLILFSAAIYLLNQKVDYQIKIEVQSFKKNKDSNLIYINSDMSLPIFEYKEIILKEVKNNKEVICEILGSTKSTILLSCPSCQCDNGEKYHYIIKDEKLYKLFFYLLK